MNQKQREFLTKHISGVHKAKVSEIRSKLIKKPSLNNHLVAAFLDDTVQMKDLDSLKKITRERVINMSSSDVLIKEESHTNNFMRNGEKANWIKLRAEDLFVLPESFTKACEEYYRITEEVEKEVSDLNDILNTIIMKIQIGSDKHLSALINDVDNIGDLSLVNSQLLLKGE